MAIEEVMNGSILGIVILVSMVLICILIYIAIAGFIREIKRNIKDRKMKNRLKRYGVEEPLTA